MADRNYMQLRNGQIISTIDTDMIPRHLRGVVASGKGWITRNSKCPCGSGRKFKKCCMLDR